jgi:hypothetical protein
MKFLIRPDKVLPVRSRGRVEYVPMSDTYTLTVRGLTAEELRELGAKIAGTSEQFVEQANQEPEDPPLPAAFQRRLEF